MLNLLEDLDCYEELNDKTAARGGFNWAAYISDLGNPQTNNYIADNPYGWQYGYWNVYASPYPYTPSYLYDGGSYYPTYRYYHDPYG